MVEIGDDTENMNINGRKNNHGAGSRRQWKSQQKLELIDEVTEAVNQVLAKGPTEYFRNMRKLIPSEVEHRRSFISKRSKYYKVLMHNMMELKKMC